MPKYYCDYCDVFLTHDSSSVRKAHNSGRNHLTNVRDYYAGLGHDKAQNIIDEITKMYESGAGPAGGPPPVRMPLPPQPNMNMGPPRGFGGPPPGFGGGPPPGFGGGPPPGFPPMNNAPPPFSGPPGMPPPSMSSGPSFPPPTMSSEGQRSVPAGMNPERARALGLA